MHLRVFGPKIHIFKPCVYGWINFFFLSLSLSLSQTNLLTSERDTYFGVFYNMWYLLKFKIENYLDLWGPGKHIWSLKSKPSSIFCCWLCSLVCSCKLTCMACKDLLSCTLSHLAEKSNLEYIFIMEWFF